jgi:hypothetical protein
MMDAYLRNVLFTYFRRILEINPHDHPARLALIALEDVEGP